MRIHITREVSVDIETTIDRDEIAEALKSSFSNAELACGDLANTNDRQKMLAVHHFAADVINCLAAINDEMIGMAKDHVRLKVIQTLQDQSDRWSSIHNKKLFDEYEP